MVEKRQAKEKKGFTVVRSPQEQPTHNIVRKFREHPFIFFRNPYNKRGELIVSKDLRKDYHYDQHGQEHLVQDFGHDEIIEFFRKSGFQIIDDKDYNKKDTLKPKQQSKVEEEVEKETNTSKSNKNSKK